MIDWALLLAALIAIESGADPDAIGDDGKAVGVLQIHPEYVEDCNRIMEQRGTSFRFALADRNVESVSRSMAITYLRYYGEVYRRRTGNQPTYEVYARIHNGGPIGYKKDATNPYWKKVRAELDRIRKGKK